MLVHVLPPSVDLKIKLLSLWGKATAAFIHASYINITRGEITRDLDVANKRVRPS